MITTINPKSNAERPTHCQRATDFRGPCIDQGTKVVLSLQEGGYTVKEFARLPIEKRQEYVPPSQVKKDQRQLIKEKRAPRKATEAMSLIKRNNPLTLEPQAHDQPLLSKRREQNATDPVAHRTGNEKQRRNHQYLPKPQNTSSLTQWSNRTSAVSLQFSENQVTTMSNISGQPFLIQDGLKILLIGFSQGATKSTIQMSLVGKPYRVFRGKIDLSNEPALFMIAEVIAEQLQTETSLIIQSLHTLSPTLISSPKQIA